MPIDYKEYPENWFSHIRPLILQRAGNRCEGTNQFPNCRAENGEPHPDTESTVVLTIMHLDHDKQNNDGMDQWGPALPVEEANLRAGCQRCHLSWDLPHHIANRKYGRNHRGPHQLKLF